ncbi:hypothetical protein CERSUDRAFT_116046, partial [Gelatoporia subvermispora B]
TSRSCTRGPASPGRPAQTRSDPRARDGGRRGRSARGLRFKLQGRRIHLHLHHIPTFAPPTLPDSHRAVPICVPPRAVPRSTRLAEPCWCPSRRCRACGGRPGVDAGPSQGYLQAAVRGKGAGGGTTNY